LRHRRMARMGSRTLPSRTVRRTIGTAGHAVNAILLPPARDRTSRQRRHAANQLAVGPPLSSMMHRRSRSNEPASQRRVLAVRHSPVRSAIKNALQIGFGADTHIDLVLSYHDHSRSERPEQRPGRSQGPDADRRRRVSLPLATRVNTGEGARGVGSRPTGCRGVLKDLAGRRKASAEATDRRRSRADQPR
jgi:hypothetical protein